MFRLNLKPSSVIRGIDVSSTYDLKWKNETLHKPLPFACKCSISSVMQDKILNSQVFKYFWIIINTVLKFPGHHHLPRMINFDALELP